MAAPFIYSAFISYSHADCGDVAPVIQKGIENIGKPWYRQKRNLDIFRDETNLSASPELWPNIELGLLNSDFLILLASPQAAKSGWITDELIVWINKNYSDKNGLQKIFIALTDGEISWDKKSNDFDWAVTNAIPVALKGKFKSEPHWVDLRPYVNQTKSGKQINYKAAGFTTAITKIIGAITGKNPRDIESAELRRNRAVNGVITIATLLFSLIVCISVFLYLSRAKQQNISRSNYLIYEASKAAPVNVNKALLFYQSAYANNTDSSVFALLWDFYKSNTITREVYMRSPDDTLALPDTLSHFFKTIENIPDVDSTQVRMSSGDYVRGIYTYSLSKKTELKFWKNRIEEKMGDSIWQTCAGFHLPSQSSPFFNSKTEVFYLVNNSIQKNSSFVCVYNIVTCKASDLITSDSNGVYSLLNKAPDGPLTEYINNLKANTLSLFDIAEGHQNNKEIALATASDDGNYLLIVPRVVGAGYRFKSNNSFTALFVDLNKLSYTLKEIKYPANYTFDIEIENVSISPDNKFIYLQLNGNVINGASLIYNFDKTTPFLKLFQNNGWSTKLNSDAPRCSAWAITGEHKTELFYGTDAGNVYVVNLVGVNEGNTNPYIVKCSTTDNYGAVTSVFATGNYIFAGTSRGNVIIWANENKYSQQVELDGYKFLTALTLQQGTTITKLFFDSPKNMLVCLSRDGVMWRVLLKQFANIDREPEKLSHNLGKLLMDR